MVVLIVNARSDPLNSNYKSPDHPGLVGMIGSVTSVPIDANTATVNSLLDVLLDEIKKGSKEAPPDAKFGDLKISQY